MTNNERILRDALTETTALITGLLAVGDIQAILLLASAGGLIEAKGFAALQHIDTLEEPNEGPECCGCVNPVYPCPDCEYPNRVIRGLEQGPGRLTDCEPPEPTLRI